MALFFVENPVKNGVDVPHVVAEVEQGRQRVGVQILPHFAIGLEQGQEITAFPPCRHGAALDRPGSDAVGQDAGTRLGKTTGVIVTDDVRAGLSQADVLIDFTRPEATLHHLDVARELGTGVVIGAARSVRRKASSTCASRNRPAAVPYTTGAPAT